MSCSVRSFCAAAVWSSAATPAKARPPSGFNCSPPSPEAASSLAGRRCRAGRS
jgi:hypothetical protein